MPERDELTVDNFRSWIDWAKAHDFGLDFFDASINRIAAWVIATRNAKKALLLGLLNPTKTLREAENAGDYTTRLAMMEDARSLPWGAVWNEYCARHDKPADQQWLPAVKQYEASSLLSRSGSQ